MILRSRDRVHPYGLYSVICSTADEHGCVDVPEGPGLGVEYDWDFILAHRTDGAVYK
jgi:L-alanine-DL-glutamate epimerase-like enolase superfamily enzyme